MPPVDGLVSYVSADRLIDKKTEQAFFSAKITLDAAMLKGLTDVEILPGDGHLLAKSDDVIVERLDAWLPEVLDL